MTTFDKREQGFESKLAHDEEIRFRAIARRNREFGLWIAGKLGKSGAEAERYAEEVVQREIEGGPERALAAVKADLEKAGAPLSDHQLRAKADELLARAVAALKTGG
ncbi:DUF1476 domain-containing protein [Methylocella sp.]|uniref:DUF1476 domain-containing protein n=1 Tax=Methylocella sp. TaxID=1978226 RepID=UPI0035B1824F